MILMYCYSSYTYSPVGFALGCLTMPIKSDSEFINLKPCKDNFVKECFKTGIIKRVYGKNPNSGHYIFMVENLECEFVNSDNMKSKKYCNFWFEFDENDKYVRFVRNFDKDQLEMVMNDFIIPDSFAETFALKIKTKALNDYIGSLLNKEPDSQKDMVNVECDDFYFETTTSNPGNSKMLSEIIGQAVTEYEPYKFSTKKKLLIARGKTFWITITVILILVVAVVWVMLSKKLQIELTIGIQMINHDLLDSLESE